MDEIRGSGQAVKRFLQLLKLPFDHDPAMRAQCALIRNLIDYVSRDPMLTRLSVQSEAFAAHARWHSLRRKTIHAMTKSASKHRVDVTLHQ